MALLTLCCTPWATRDFAAPAMASAGSCTPATPAPLPSAAPPPGGARGGAPGGPAGLPRPARPAPETPRAAGKPRAPPADRPPPEGRQAQPQHDRHAPRHADGEPAGTWNPQPPLHELPADASWMSFTCQPLPDRVIVMA